MTNRARRRLGLQTAENRALLVEAAGQLMAEEGYAAVTARRVAEKAGLKVPLVYYYFQDMDSLILEVARRNAAKRREKFDLALTEPDPLRALWIMNRDTASANFTTEILALANHRETIRAEVVALAREFRALQIEAMERILANLGVTADSIQAGALVTILAALSRAMAQDCALGVDEGYDEAVALVERGLAWLSEGGPAVAEKPAGDEPGSDSN